MKKPAFLKILSSINNWKLARLETGCAVWYVWSVWFGDLSNHTYKITKPHILLPIRLLFSSFVYREPVITGSGTKQPELHRIRCTSFIQNGMVCMSKCKYESGMLHIHDNKFMCKQSTWAPSSEFGTYRLCEQRRFRRACASAQSRQNLRCSLIQAVSQEEPSDRKPDPWPLWMAGHAQLKFVMTECSKTQIRLTRPTCIWFVKWNNLKLHVFFYICI